MTKEELLADLTDYFSEWIDGDNPVIGASINDDGQLSVVFDNFEMFCISVKKND